MWAASLAGVAVWAQRPTVEVQGRAPNLEVRPGQAYGPIISGQDIGFQRVWTRSGDQGRIAGRLMVRVDGEWFEASAAFAVTPAHAR